MPDGKERKKRNDSVKAKASGLAKGGRKYTWKEHSKRDKLGRAKAAKARHDMNMRATGRKKVGYQLQKRW